MNNDLSDYRKSYEKGALLKSNVPENPMELFQSSALVEYIQQKMPLKN